MSIKKIREHNPQLFLDDIKRINTVMVLCETTGSYYHIMKREVKKDAETKYISYYKTNGIFKNGRDVMIIF